MSFKTITISTDAYSRLKKWKQGNESFTEMILRELPDPDRTGAEIVDELFKKRPKRRRHAKTAA